MKIKIGNSTYLLPKPPLKTSVNGVQFLFENYGDGISNLLVNFLDREKDVTSDLFKGVFEIFNTQKNVIQKTLDTFITKEFITYEDGHALNQQTLYEEGDLSLLFRIVFEIIKKNYGHFFLSNFKKSKLSNLNL